MRQLFPSLRRHVSKRRQNRNWVVSAKPTLEALEDRIVPAVAIPDQSTVFATFEVTEAVQIADVNVTLDITHGRAKDLDVFLISPSNTRVELFTDVGGNGDDFSGTTLDDEAATPITSGSAPFSGSFQPEGSLSDFDGEDAQGTWRLEISDDQKNVEGVLNIWSVTVTPLQGVLSIDDVQQTEGDSGTTAFVFTVARGGDTSGTSSVNFATADGSAIAGSDYVATSGMLQFLAGETSKTISVEVNGDTITEQDETFVLDLSNASGATISDAQSVGTILNDDGDVIPNDPMFSDQWGLNNTGQTGGLYDADIDMPAAWSVTTGSMSTVVAVLDNGVDYTHEDLYLNIWLNQGEITASLAASLTDTDADGLITFRDLNDAANAAYVTDLNGTGYIDAGDLLADPTWEDGVDTDGNGYVDDLVGWDFYDNDNDPIPEQGRHHGTIMAGIIGAVGDNGVGVAGVNWNVQIMPIRTHVDQPPDDAKAIAGLNFAVANGATISSNSWGGNPYNQEFFDAINTARTNGHLFVAAAHNQGSDNDVLPVYPASYGLDNVISVAAVDEANNLASFSNFGLTSVDLAAPSPSILSTAVGNTYGTSNGSSASTAQVSGVAALLRTLHPTWTYAQIRDQIFSTVDPLPSLVGKTVTGGRLNAAAAVSTSSIHVTDPIAVEGDSGTTDLVFTVSRRGDTSQSLTLDWATEDGTATADSDYVAASGQVFFGIGVAEQMITVVVNGDGEGEADETVYLNLGIAAGTTTIADAKSQGTIQNDDTANANDTYVWDITSDTRSRGPNLDYRIEVVVRQDSNADGNVGGADAFVAGAQVTVSVTGPDGATLSGTTDSNGVFRSNWVKSVSVGSYTAVVDSMTLTPPLVRNTNLDVVTSHNFTVGSALLAESLGSNDEASSITPEVAQFLLGEAMRRFASEGADVASLHGVNVRITDLDGMTLGMTTGNRIVLDDNAAGHGYFIDPTPWEDSEFIIPGDQGEQGHIDALSVVAHELGHLLGFAHEEQGVMKETLATGERSLLHATASGTAEASPAALSSTQEKTRTIPFRVNGGGLAPKGIPVFPGGTAPHDATGIAAHLGLYSGEGADPQSDVFRLINFTSATTGTFESVQPFVFTAANGDQLAFHYGRTDAGATTTGTFEIFDAGDGLIYVVFVAEFTPVAEESTGRFANVTGGSFIMVATTEPFSLIPDEPFSEPFSYTWEGEGTIELANGRT